MSIHTKYFKNKQYLEAFSEGIFFFALASIVQFFAINYATKSVSNPVTDIVLSNIRVYGVQGIFVYGAAVMGVFIIMLGILHPKYLPFGLKSIALFAVIRSIAISLTHTNIYPTHAIIGSLYFGKFFDNIFTGNDLFFSGHTGLPFFMALMFWRHKILRYIFLSFSFFFAIIVLLGHLHYSIDVFSAFFIAYGIFHISTYLFKKDWQMFRGK